MSDRTFGMCCSHIDVTCLAMGNGFLELLDPLVQMRVLRILLSRLAMFECSLSMLHQGIPMPLFAMRHGFLGMFQGFTHMLVIGKGEPTEQRKTNKRGNRYNDHCSAMDSHFHGSLLSG